MQDFKWNVMAVIVLSESNDDRDTLLDNYSTYDFILRTTTMLWPRYERYGRLIL